MTSIPAMAKLLALSPSVKIKVHFYEFLVPASFASYSLGIPVSLAFFAPPVSLASFDNSFDFASLYISSIMPVFNTYLINFSLRVHLDPNKDCFKVKVYFVCESNAGFSMSALTKIHRWALIWKGFTFKFLSFFNNFYWIFSTIWSVT